MLHTNHYAKVCIDKLIHKLREKVKDENEIKFSVILN